MPIDRPALQTAKAWGRARTTISGVYDGFKYVNGQRTETRSLVFAVPKKLSTDQVPVDERVPPDFDGVPTDVIEGTYKALGLTTKQRPCPAGYSVGHYLITAGTFGVPVKRGESEDWLCLTNNHVAANENKAAIADHVVQPGAYDGGANPADWWASLEEFVTINFKGQTPGGGGTRPPKPPPKPPRDGGSGGGGRVIRALRILFGREAVVSLAIPQPTPNLVDAAVCRPVTQDVLAPEVYDVGPVQGIRDLQLGEHVHKVGRTTSHTFGIVVGVGGLITVGYDSKTAVFDDQVIIEGDGGSEFSAGGDSGSAILTEDNYVGGLLFAGGGNQTIANKMSHVQALLGVRV